MIHYYHHHSTSSNSYSTQSSSPDTYSDEYESSFSGGCFTEYHETPTYGAHWFKVSGSGYQGKQEYSVTCQRCGATGYVGTSMSVENTQREYYVGRDMGESGEGCTGNPTGKTVYYTRSCGRREGEIVTSVWNYN